jgi:glycosyltransferase involved in cell wall biosynthesis
MFPKISITMATYNGGKYIYAQLESILKQLSESDEVVISDDSSTDNTIEIIKNFKDKRIQLYEHNHFCSPVFNFENALKKASGDIIFLSDQDDIWLDNKVAVITKLLQSYNLVVSDCVLVDESGGVLRDSFFKLRDSGAGIIHNLIKNSYIGCCMAFNREILERALPFPNNIEMHDMWIGIIGEFFGKTYFCKEKLVKYRRHNDNASQTSEKSVNSFMKKIHIRTILIYEVLKRYMELRGRKKA